VPSQTGLISRRLRRFVRLALAALLALALPALAATGFARPTPADSAPRHSTQIREIALSRAPEGLVIHAGLTLRNVYALNLSEQSFMAEGWYWLSWDDAVQAVLSRYKIQSNEIIEFANEIEPAQYRNLEVLPDAVGLPAGSNHSFYAKFSGKFYIDSVAQHRAPFDHQHLRIDMEIRPAVLAVGADRVELIPFSIKEFPIAGEFASVSGYGLGKTSWRRSSLVYVEPVGGVPGVGADDSVNHYSRITADLTYSPNHLTVFLKWLLPLMVVMAVVILSPSIDGALGDVRLAIPSAALLTLVVLHDGYKSYFPPAPYMTYLDKIYTYSYIVCLAIFLLFLVGTNAHSACHGDQRDAVVRRVNRLDLFVQLASVLGFVVVAWWSWYS
jgi:hypothetical protein